MGLTESISRRRNERQGRTTREQGEEEIRAQPPSYTVSYTEIEKYKILEAKGSQDNIRKAG